MGKWIRFKIWLSSKHLKLSLSRDKKITNSACRSRVSSSPGLLQAWQLNNPYKNSSCTSTQGITKLIIIHRSRNSRQTTSHNMRSKLNMVSKFLRSSSNSNMCGCLLMQRKIIVSWNPNSRITIIIIPAAEQPSTQPPIKVRSNHNQENNW